MLIKIIVIAGSAAWVMSIAVGTAIGQLSETTDVEAQALFIPTGFDDNDQVEVVVDGMLPNSCYELVAGEFTINDEDRTATLFPKAVVRNGICLQVLVPYSHVFNLGVLPLGSYNIKVAGADVETLAVAEANNSGPDDVTYASIDNAYIMDLPAQHEQRIVLEGTYTSTCMVWDKTEVIINNPDVIEVLPTVRIEARDNCEDRVIPFKGVSVKLPKLGEKGRFLLHVRSMNGTSINRVFSYDPL